MSTWDEDGCDQVRRLGDWLISVTEQGVRHMQERGDHQGALSTVDEAMKEARREHPQWVQERLGPLRAEIAAFLAKQEAESKVA